MRNTSAKTGMKLEEKYSNNKQVCNFMRHTPTKTGKTPDKTYSNKNRYEAWRDILQQKQIWSLTRIVIILSINPLTARVVGAPQMNSLRELMTGLPSVIWLAGPAANAWLNRSWEVLTTSKNRFVTKAVLRNKLFLRNVYQSTAVSQPRLTLNKILCVVYAYKTISYVVYN